MEGVSSTFLRVLEMIHDEVGTVGVVLFLLVCLFLYMYCRKDKHNNVLSQSIVKEVREGSSKYVAVVAENSESNRELAAALQNMSEKLDEIYQELEHIRKERGRAGS